MPPSSPLEVVIPSEIGADLAGDRGLKTRTRWHSARIVRRATQGNWAIGHGFPEVATELRRLIVLPSRYEPRSRNATDGGTAQSGAALKPLDLRKADDWRRTGAAESLRAYPCAGTNRRGVVDERATQRKE